jgi:hypothetical protein
MSFGATLVFFEMLVGAGVHIDFPKRVISYLQCVRDDTSRRRLLLEILGNCSRESRIAGEEGNL